MAASSPFTSATVRALQSDECETNFFLKRNTHTHKGLVYFQNSSSMQRTHPHLVCRLFPQRQGQSAAPEEGALTQILSTEPLQRENFTSFLCLMPPPTTPCTLFVLPLQLTSSLSIRQPLSFYLPQITLALHYLCLFFFFALLVFGTDLTTALQCRGRCINTLVFFLPSYLQGVQPRGFILSR